MISFKVRIVSSSPFSAQTRCAIMTQSLKGMLNHSPLVVQGSVYNPFASLIRRNIIRVPALRDLKRTTRLQLFPPFFHPAVRPSDFTQVVICSHHVQKTHYFPPFLVVSKTLVFATRFS